ncbi:MAG: RIP metalloprotease RseP [Maritimibacter sp.]
MEFIPNFGNIGFTIAAFVVAIMVIVSIHEYGHYIIGRWTGIKADVFSIGMGPKLFSKVDKHGTRWQVAALPIGGYVKFRGDADASSGKADASAMEGLTPEERRATMHGAPLWARALTVLAGPVFNFILSAIIFSVFYFSGGVATDPLSVAKVKAVPGLEQSFEPGDVLLSINGQPVPLLEAFASYAADLPDQATVDYVIERDGQEQTITTLHPYPPFVSSVSPQSAAYAAGLQEFDLITAIDGVSIATFEDLRDAVTAGEGAPMTLTLNRAGDMMDVTLTPKQMDLPLPEGGFETRYLIGIGGTLIFEPATVSPGIGEAIWGGISQVGFVIKSSVSGLYHMVVGNISSCNLSGPIGIAETAGAAASGGIDNFIWLIAVLSTAIGFLNLFPIPVLDGGHLVFHAYEALSGKPPSDGALRILMTIGLVLVISLMVFGLTNDVFCP